MSKLIETIELHYACHCVVQCSVTPVDDAEDVTLALAVENAKIVTASELTGFRTSPKE